MAGVTETARQRVAKLNLDWDWPDPALLDDILALGDEAIPALAELLTPELLADSQVDGAAESVVYYSAALLGELQRPDAIPVLMRLYAQIEEDELVETVSDALRRIGPASIASLLTVAADPALPYYCRTQACEAAVALAGRDLLRRAQVAAVLRPLLASYMARQGALSEDDRTLIAVLVNSLAEIADLPARPLIEAAFDAGRVGGEFSFGGVLPDMLYATREDIEELYQKGGEDFFRAPDPFMERYRKDYRKHQEEQQKRLAAPPPPPPAPPQTVVFTARLGRNDACWCGSGKKYKKCHLPQDEKEKVRL